MHVVERARRADLVQRVIVATDDQRIAEAVSAHGGEAWMTSSDAQSGTDRVAEVAQQLDAELIVNVQGDEPLIAPSAIDAAIQALLDDEHLQMSTTSEPIVEADDVFNPNVVKVVCDSLGFALYFSRSPVPYIRSSNGLPLREALASDGKLIAGYRKHSGLYAYRRNFLLWFSRVEPSRLEKLEALEQLRAIENGTRIKVVAVEERSIGVDTEQDYQTVKRLIEENRK
jgi:3-deoxy-manno-octulosonate cytidylyltransferase (CMP-KDO synthetase)